MKPYGDIFNENGTLNLDYIRWLVKLSIQRGWIRPGRKLNDSEIATALKWKNHHAG